MIKIDHWLDKLPHQFAYFHRLIGYGMLSILLLVYNSTMTEIQYQHYLPILMGLIMLVAPRLATWLHYSFDKQFRREIFFFIDSVVIALSLSAVHLNIVLTFSMLMVLIYTAINSRVNIFTVVVAIMLGTATFYLGNRYVFGFGQYFEQTSNELIILTFLFLSLYFGIGTLYQLKRLQNAHRKRRHYYTQMGRYMEFANQLSRYAPLQLWQSIMKGETEAKIEYKRKEMTIFFSDIQGFTELSESLIPDDLAFLLNDYLSHMTDIAKKYEGTVDKFMGDAILIFFGDPITQGSEQDAKTCVEMALAMRQQMKLLRERWMKMGYPPLHIRMGVSTGYCHVGNYGASHRMAYTIVGRDANLAARLQSAAEVDEILLSDATYKLVRKDFLCVPKSPIHLKGIQAPVQTWQVVEKHAATQEEYQRWFDYEYKGFHLLLNLDEVQNYEYAELIEVLEKMLQRVKVQQKLTNPYGVVDLRLEDEIKK